MLWDRPRSACLPAAGNVLNAAHGFVAGAASFRTITAFGACRLPRIHRAVEPEHSYVHARRCSSHPNALQRDWRIQTEVTEIDGMLSVVGYTRRSVFYAGDLCIRGVGFFPIIIRDLLRSSRASELPQFVIRRIVETGLSGKRLRVVLPALAGVR